VTRVYLLVIKLIEQEMNVIGTGNNIIRTDEAYNNWITSLKKRYRNSQIKAASSVNREMLMFYWELGRNLEVLKTKYGWGTGFYKTVSRDIERELSGVKSFSPRNLLYMHQFYRLYTVEGNVPQVGEQLDKIEITPQVVAQLDIFTVPWGIEVKTRAFEPGDMGQIGTYVAVVDDMLRKNGDTPTVGLLVCKNKNNVLAQYAVNSSNAPVGISEYELSDLMPENFKGTLPSIEDIERELKRN
jgi:hypothetical protein